MAIEQKVAVEQTETKYCTRHPDRETLVSCGRCGKPYCIDCLVHTPAGQRCYECAGVRRDFAQRSAISAFGRAVGAVALGAAIASIAGFFSLIIAGMVGGVFAQTISPHVNRHTKPWIYLPVALAMLGGAAAGFTLAVLARAIIAGVPLILVAAAPFAIVMSGSYWLFIAIASVVAYIRMR